MSQWTDMYKQKLMTAEEAVKVVKSGDWVDYGMGTTQPVLLDQALAARRDELWPGCIGNGSHYSKG